LDDRVFFFAFQTNPSFFTAEKQTSGYNKFKKVRDKIKTWHAMPITPRTSPKIAGAILGEAGGG